MIFIRFLILLCLSYIIILRIAPILFFDPHGSKGIGLSLEIYGVSTQIKRNLLLHFRGIYIVKLLIYRIFDAFSGVGSGKTFRERVERLIAGEDFLFMNETQAAACVSRRNIHAATLFKNGIRQTFFGTSHRDENRKKQTVFIGIGLFRAPHRRRARFLRSIVFLQNF